MKKFSIIIFIFLQISIYSQDADAYNKIYYKTYLETSQIDFKSAVKVADSLFLVSETPLFQTKSLMLSASLYQQSGAVKKSISYALQSAEIIEQTDNYNWQAKVYGFLASEYRKLKLYNQSKKYFEKGLAVSSRITNPKSANNIAGLMQQERAYYEIGTKNYKKAIAAVNKAQEHFNLAETDLQYFTANNEQLLGLCYYNLNDFDKAKKHYLTALSLSQSNLNGFITGLIYIGLAEVYLEQKDLKKVKKYLDLAEKISKKSPYLQFKEELLSVSQKYYAAINDFKNVVEVKKQQDSVVNKITSQSAEFIDQSFTKMEKDNKVVETKSSNKTILLIAATLALLMSNIYFIVNRRRQKKELANFRKILKNINEKNALVKENSTILIEKNPQVQEDLPLLSPKDEPSVIMPAETEQKILLKLKEFEIAELFKENNISLATLATYCETNLKYLSYIINSYKKQDFNNYINELRVNYIIKKLQDYPTYRKYKMSVLSEEAGFSSQNKFATNFKKVTSISPSIFIKFLNENQNT